MGGRLLLKAETNIEGKNMKHKSLLIALALIALGSSAAHAQIAPITCPIPLSLNPANTKLLVGQSTQAFSAPDTTGQCFTEIRTCKGDGVLSGSLLLGPSPGLCRIILPMPPPPPPGSCQIPPTLLPSPTPISGNTSVLNLGSIPAFSAPDSFGRCYTEIRICNNGVLGGTLIQTRSTACATTLPLPPATAPAIPIPTNYANYGQPPLPGMVIGYAEPIPLTNWQNMLSGIGANIANLTNQITPANVSFANQILSAKASLQKNYDALKLKITSMQVFGYRSMIGSAAVAPTVPPGALPFPQPPAPRLGNKLFFLKALVKLSPTSLPMVPPNDPFEVADLCVSNGYSASLTTLPTSSGSQTYSSSAMCVSMLTMALTNRPPPPPGIIFPPGIIQPVVTASTLNTAILNACNAIPSGAIVTFNCM
jgi:hypothetical protein